MIAQDMVFDPLIDNTPECPALYGAAVPQRILRCDEPRLRIPLRRLSGYIFDEA
ncbi:MAG: hypothetical protein LBD93_02610 [Treponema sp.]|nr:hypothetical protein [Treponema sp.]